MPDTHITKNFFTDNGDELVIGGKLTVLEGATVEGLAGGSVTPAAAVADSEATTVAQMKTDFNALLASLRAAGFLAASEAGGG